MKNLLMIGLACGLALTGCFDLSNPLTGGQLFPKPVIPDTCGTKAIQVSSDPAGARVEVNDNYVGDTPITVQIPIVMEEGKSEWTKAATSLATVAKRTKNPPHLPVILTAAIRSSDFVIHHPRLLS